MNQYWEYNIKWVTDLTEKALNRIGKEGWELISHEPFFNRKTNELTRYRLVLKRVRAR